MQHHQQHYPNYAATKPPSALFVSPNLYSSAATSLWNHPQPPQLSPEDEQLDDDEEDDSDISSDEQDGVYDDVIEDDDYESSSAHTNFAQLPSALNTAVPDAFTTSENSTQRVEDLFEDVARAYAEMVCWLWFSHPTDQFNPTSLQRQLQPTDHFVEWLRRVITMTQLSSTVVILSLHYLTKLKKPRNAPGSDNPHLSLFNSVNPARGSEYLVAVVALMLANKVMDDNTYTNKSWAWMCGANLEQINAAEREFLVATRHELHVDQNMLNAWKYVLLGHIKARASRVASIQAVSLQPQARSTQSQPRQLILRARSASPEPGQFTLSVPRRAPVNPPARQAARPTSYIGPPPPTQHWLLPEAPSRSSTGVKRSAEAAFSPRTLAAPIPHPSERIRQAAHAASAVPIPPARRVYAPAVSRRVHLPPGPRLVAPHHPPPVEFNFAQMTLSGSNHGTPLYPTPPVPSSPARVPQLAMPHVPATLPSLDTHSAPPLQFYQLVQGGRILRAATPAGGRSSTAAQQPQLAVRIPTEHYRYAAPPSRRPYTASSASAGPSPSPIERCEAPGCKSHTTWTSQPRPELPLSSVGSSDSSMQLYPPQHISKPSFATPSPQTHTMLPPCRALLYPSAANSPMSMYTPPQTQAFQYSPQGASPALVAEYAQFANAGSPGFQWATAPSSSSTVYRERPSSGVFYSLSSPLTHHMLYSAQSAYPLRTVAITPLQQYALQQQQQQQQQQAPRTVPYEYTALPQHQLQHQQSASSSRQAFHSPVGYS